MTLTSDLQERLRQDVIRTLSLVRSKVAMLSSLYGQVAVYCTRGNLAIGRLLEDGTILVTLFIETDDGRPVDGLLSNVMGLRVRRPTVGTRISREGPSSRTTLIPEEYSTPLIRLIQTFVSLSACDAQEEKTERVEIPELLKRLR